MYTRAIRLPAAVSDGSTPDDAALRSPFEGLRSRLKLPADYPADALAEAQQAASSPQLPEQDETAVPFFTIDPPESKDLDQAMYLERSGDGYRVRYAIADVPAYVLPGGALDAETRRRGETIYLPDGRIPLHPAVLSEDAASLLPDKVRPAFVWDLQLAADGQVTDAQVYLAKVKSVRRLDYTGVQGDVDGGNPDPALVLLKEIGELRIELEQQRGGASLEMPEQEVSRGDDGTYHLDFRPLVAAEDWNAQISLMTGMAAAEMMLHAQVGVLRTMPPPDHDALARFHRQAAALGVPWDANLPYGEFLRTLDRNNPRHLALIHEAAGLFRGAGYTVFDGDVPEVSEQAAVAAPYAHVTAPLRRLVDRFGLVICEAVCRGAEIPDWVRQALPSLPELMKSADSLTHKAERAATDIVEAAVLRTRVGETFDAVVVDQGGKGGVTVQLIDVAVVADCAGSADLGAQVSVRLEAVVIAAGTLSFVLA